MPLNNEKINAAAERIISDRAENINFLAHAADYDYLFAELQAFSENLGKAHGRPAYLNADIVKEVYTDAFMNALAKFRPGNDFVKYFISVLHNAAKDEWKRANRHVSIEEEEENGTPPKAPRTSDSDSALLIENYYRLLASTVLASKRIYMNKKTICYAPLFFTDDIECSYEFGAENVNALLKKNAKEFDEAADIEFLNSFMSRPCKSTSDIENNICKPLSSFTGKDADKNTDCRNSPLINTSKEPSPLNALVYILYAAAKFHKNITDSAVSQQRNKYNALKLGSINK